MNKKVVVGLTTAAAFSTVMMGGNNANAEEATTNKMTTDGSISFFSDSTPGGGPFEGNLALAYVPTTFDFGNHDVAATATAATYAQKFGTNADGTAKTAVKQYLAVSDDRADKKNGWSVKATLNEFQNTAVDDKGVSTVTKLDKAELSFNLGTAQKYNIDTKLSDAAKPATPTPAITADNALSAMTPTQLAYYAASPATVTLVAGATKEVEVLDYATQTQSEATTLAVAKEVSSVQLKVKDHSNVKDKKFTSKVNWTLAEDPTI